MNNYYAVKENDSGHLWRVIGPCGKAGLYDEAVALQIASSNSEAYKEGQSSGAKLLVSEFIPVLISIIALAEAGDSNYIAACVGELIRKLRELL